MKVTAITYFVLSYFSSCISVPCYLHVSIYCLFVGEYVTGLPSIRLLPAAVRINYSDRFFRNSWKRKNGDNWEALVM